MDPIFTVIITWPPLFRFTSLHLSSVSHEYYYTVSV